MTTPSTEPLVIYLAKGVNAIIDSDDYDKIKDYKWSCSKLGYVSSVINSYKPGQKRNKIQKTIYLHKLIMGESSKFIDHIDGNSLNNRKSNLRFCTQMENSRNQSIKSNNTSGYKGVSWSKSMRKWEASISPNYKRIVLGYFINKIEAAIAYNEAAIKYFGRFAKLNII